MRYFCDGDDSDPLPDCDPGKCVEKNDLPIPDLAGGPLGAPAENPDDDEEDADTEE